MADAADTPRPVQLALPGFDEADARWRSAYDGQVGPEDAVRNRSGIPIEPLYTEAHWSGTRYMDDLGFPGEPPWTRGIYASMHRGRAWARRQLVGMRLPDDYRARLKALLDSGLNAVSVAPCNSFMRGFDADQVDPVLLGTCGVVINTLDDLRTCLADVDLGAMSVNLGDNAPFTLTAMTLALAEERGVPWTCVSGTSNQSDYLSHHVANHMFLRLSLPGARRMTTDFIDYTTRLVPRWNPLSVVGQHMQQAGATPAEAMAFTLCSAIQYAEDCRAAGLRLEEVLPRFSFFFDLSISFFEEVAKLRAGRRIWGRIVRDHFGIDDPRCLRFRFHAQTSGVDLTRQQPLNNIARVAIQAAAGIFGGLQSLHTDSFDEALSSPTEKAARVAVATQAILCEEAGLTEVIDPLGGSYYVEALTNAMEAEIERVMAVVAQAGGMYAAVEAGLVQRMIGESARAYQDKVERGAQTMVGVNAYVAEEDPADRPPPLRRLAPTETDDFLGRLDTYKKRRDAAAVTRALDAIARAAADPSANLFEQVVAAVRAGATHGEICTRAREVLGAGDPRVAA
jgi:methylmalonyl-CoA mutase N-terminal domain/subunit